MTRDEKFEFVNQLTEQIKANPNFFLLDIGGFSVEKTFAFRKKCFEGGYKLQTVKNTLLRKALNQLDGDYVAIDQALTYSTALLFVGDSPNAPAKMIKAFKADAEKPRLKAAVVEQTVFTGDNTLKAMIDLKSKSVLLGEIVASLQAPAQNVISALKGQGSKIAGLLEAIAEKKAN